MHRLLNALSIFRITGFIASDLRIQNFSFWLTFLKRQLTPTPTLILMQLVTKFQLLIGLEMKDYKANKFALTTVRNTYFPMYLRQMAINATTSSGHTQTKLII